MYRFYHAGAAGVTGGGEGAGGPPLIINDYTGGIFLASPEGWPGLSLPTPGEPLPAFNDRAIVGHPFVQSILVRAPPGPPGLVIPSLEGWRPAWVILERWREKYPDRKLGASWHAYLVYCLGRAVGQLRVELCNRLRAGDFRVEGIDSAGHPSVVQPDLFNNPDMVWRERGWALHPEQQPEQYTLPPSPKLPSLIGLRLWPAEAEAKRPVAPATDEGALRVPPPRRRAGQDFRESDDVLAEEIVKGVKDATGRRLLSDWEAEWALAPRAEGKGTTESKQKRLSKRVQLLRRQKLCLSSEPTE